MDMRKTPRLAFQIVAGLVLVMLAACQSSQQELAIEEGLGNENGFDDFGNEGGDNFADEGFNNFENNFGNFENNFDNEFAENDGFDDAGFDNQFSDGEAINSATGNEFAFNEGTGENDLFSNQNFQGDQFNNEAMFANQGQNFAFENNNPLFNQGEQALFNEGNGIEDVAMQEEPVEIEAVSNNTDTVIPSEGGLVKYVLQDGTALRDQPAGSSVRSMEQGDHPLVFDEGEWSRTSDGYYVSTIEITPDPVPRRKLRANWTY